MESLEFNKSLFVRNDDDAFKIAIMFSRYQQIPKAYQTALFYANSDSVDGKINLLTFSEMFNETLEYVNNWLNDLDTIKDEYDWKFYRTKLLTRFVTQKQISANKIMDKMKLSYPSEAQYFKNTTIIWNNAIILAEDGIYKENKSDVTWELWDILLKFKYGNIDTIDANKNHYEELQKVIHYRNEDGFYFRFSSRLNDDKELFTEIGKLVKDFETIMLKNNLNNEIPLISRIAKRLKI